MNQLREAAHVSVKWNGVSQNTFPDCKKVSSLGAIAKNKTKRRHRTDDRIAS